jgi:hypothetical protein
MDLMGEFVRYCNLLYSGRDVAEANHWLMQLSQQESCWQVLLPIIDDYQHGEAALFFAIKLLHRCIQMRWHELESDDQAYILQVDFLCHVVYTSNIHTVIGWKNIHPTQRHVHQCYC